MLQLYDKLLELPLFIGISTDELSDIVGQTKFGFHKLVADKPLVSMDDKCTQLFFLMNGTLRVISHADNHRYRIEEELSAPAVIQPEHFFGLMQRYTRILSRRQIVVCFRWISQRCYVYLIIILFPP